MHIVLLCAEGRSPTEIARALFCSRTTVYTVVARFIWEEQAAFNDRKRRGPKPLLEEPAKEYIERLVEEELPTSHGGLRSRWSCKLLAVELFKVRAGIRLHPLPSWSPESNPMELVWWSLHEVVSRNHECSGLDDLVEFAEGYFKERQPFRLKLGEVYEQLERSPPLRLASVHLSRGPI